MQLIEVKDPQSARDFLKVNTLINRNDPNFIHPLEKDIREVFDSKKNKTFRFGEVTRWILKDDNDQLVGRVAAFVNKRYKNKGDDVPIGGLGFFECINDQAAADMLFDVSKHWLIRKGMQAMDGPINFGERDRWWGLLVEGFDAPLYCMSYNPPYYKVLFENYGFRNFYNQICYAMSVSETLQPKFFQRHDTCAKDPGFSAKHIRKNEMDKFARDFTIVYNKAWAGHGGLKELSEAVVKKMFRSMKPVIDESISWFVYYNEEPVGIWVNLPDINQWFRQLKGKFSLWHKLKFLLAKKTQRCDRFVGLVFGVVPEWQGKGVDSYMIVEGAKLIQSQHYYDKYEMQWIGEFNPKMINMTENLGPSRSRIFTTYRYLFDRTKEFKRHPILH